MVEKEQPGPVRRKRFHLRRLVPIPSMLLRPVPLSLRTFRPRVNLRIERSSFIIKTAENEEELARVLKLRYDVFYRELLERRLLLGIDIDKFDFKCDHLVVIDKKTDTFIGTYRLISSAFSSRFYSETEFHLDPILELPGGKLELGRACVHRDFRNGATIALLWRGISEYMRATGAKYLFGCSSFKTTDRREIGAIYRYLREAHMASPSLNVIPRRKFRIRQFGRFVDAAAHGDGGGAVAGLIPPLVKSYFSMGALVCGEPALDRKFKCADFLTLFNLDASSEKVHRKYRI